MIALVGPRRRAALVGTVLLAAGACRDAPDTSVPGGGLPSTALPAVRTGGHVAGPWFPEPYMANPYEGDELARAEGERLYVWYNCGGCHGMQGGGGIGPPFADGSWIYGGEPNVVFQSIVQGRPNGMPAYSILTDDHVWKLVLRVRELAGETAGPGPQEAGEGFAPGGGGGGRGGIAR